MLKKIDNIYLRRFLLVTVGPLYVVLAIPFIFLIGIGDAFVEIKEGFAELPEAVRECWNYKGSPD